MTHGSAYGLSPSNTYWCRKGTMYALTNTQSYIPGLSGYDVNQAIINQNGGASDDFRNALTDRTNLSYGFIP